MYQEILAERTQPVITPEQLASFGRFDVPQKYAYGSSPAVLTDDYQMLLTMIEAATDEIESMAAQACLSEQRLETYDFFPGQADPRNYFLGLNYQFLATPWWWVGFPVTDGIELVYRPVMVPSGSPLTNNLVVTYNDTTGAKQTFDPSNYTVFADKITLNVGCTWPLTDRRQDCVQISYYAGYSLTDPTQVPARLIMAILYLANHFYNVRQIITVEPTSEVGMTLCRMLRTFRSMRIPR
jgi:hypothetical protein